MVEYARGFRNKCYKLKFNEENVPSQLKGIITLMLVIKLTVSEESIMFALSAAKLSITIIRLKLEILIAE